MDSNSPDILEERKKNLFKSVLSEKEVGEAGQTSGKVNFLKYFKISKTSLMYLIFLLPILIISYIIRVGNLSLLKGKYLVGLDDPYFWYRYSLTIVEKGSLPVIDYLRYSPVGYPTAPYSTFTHTLAYMYKFFHVFSPKLTVMQWHIMYPVVISVIAFFFFFLFVRELFGNKIALLSTAFLTVVPAYIFRTSAGFADHEALGMLYLFLSLWFFTLMWKSDWKGGILFGALSGLFTGLMFSTWGGAAFILVTVALFVLISIFFTKVDFTRYISYTVWIISYYLSSTYFMHLSPLQDIKSFYFALLIFANLTLLLFLIFKNKEIKLIKRLEEKLPLAAIAIIISALIVIIPAIVLKVVDIVSIINALTLKSATRFGTTVSESMQTFFFYDWWGSFGWLLLFGVLGAVYLFYKLFKESKKYGLIMLLSMSFFLLSLILARLSGSQNHAGIVRFFSGATPYIFAGFLIFVSAMYLYIYLKDRDKFTEMFKDTWNLLFMLIFFLLCLFISRGNTRLLFFMAVPMVIAAAYFIITVANELAAYKNLKYLGYILIIISIAIFLQMANVSAGLNKGIGSNAPGQWEMYTNWLKANTPLNSVVAAWWDYGYWTQTGGERASIGDNGNLKGWNHWLGREAMTGTNSDEYFSYLKTHNATHLMFSREEIGKYHAFSFIGSDENLDRYSTIGNFVYQEEKEMRNSTRIYYKGGWGLDNDFALGTLVIPQGQSYIFSVSIDNNAEKEIENPMAYIVYNNNQYSVNVKCVCDYTKRTCKEFEYSSDVQVMDGCITLAPYYSSDTQMLPGGVAFWTSSKVRYGLMGRLYIQNEELPYFKEVYNDSVPLGLYQGVLIGPVRVWEIEYPANVKTNDTYMETSIYG